MSDYHKCLDCSAMFLPTKGENIAYCKDCSKRLSLKDMSRVTDKMVKDLNNKMREDIEKRRNR